MQAVIDLISRVRNIRAEMNIKPGDRIQLMIAAKPDCARCSQPAQIKSRV